MNYPKTLKIGAHRYKLIFSPSWEGTTRDDLGETNYETRTIYIKAGLPETVAFETFIHEVFHVINAQLDHVLLESLSEQLTQVLVDNGLVDVKP